MFADKLEIGVKGFSVEVPIELASTLDDCTKLARGNADYVVACFNRAHRINLQERSGARETVRKAIASKDAGMLKTPAFAASVVKLVTETISKWVPGARRAPVAAPPKVTVPKGKKSFTLAELQALGLVVETE